jgi:serine/threonine protein kinase
MAKQLLSDMRPPGALTPADLLSYQPYVGHFAKYFIQKSVLGKGGFATVYEAIDKLDGIGYAVKAIKFKTVAHFLKHYEKILREVRLLARLSHKHVIRYYGAWIELTPLDGSISFSESYDPPISSPKTILKAHTVFEELFVHCPTEILLRADSRLIDGYLTLS